MTKIISITNQKGGVGKTTTAINLSASLSAMEKKVLLIDIDPQANATSGMNLRIKDEEVSIYDFFLGEATLKDMIKHSELEFFSLIPSENNLAAAEVEIAENSDREFILKKALEDIQNDYDYIIIDCPPTLGFLTINALVASDSVLVPIQCEFYALEGLGQLLNTIRLMKKSLNKNLAIEGYVMTMYDPRLNLSKQVMSEAQKYFGDLVFETVIPRNVRLSEAPSFGKPIILYDVLSTGAKSYMNLAKEVINRGKNKK